MNGVERIRRIGKGLLSTAVAGFLLWGGGLVTGGQSILIQASDHVVYVDASATGVPNGLSWSTAYTNVQDALLAATSGDEVWVAEGIYYPDDGVGQTANSVTATFQLTSGVGLYGGFAATETVRSEQNVSGNVTILSGDLAQDDLPFAPETDSDGDPDTFSQTDHLSGTNAYHVVTGSGTDNTAVLDGFTVTAGRAEMYNYGGGMYNYEGSPTVAHVIFNGNATTHSGGGMYNIFSNPNISYVIFTNNTADDSGGGMMSVLSNPTVTHVIFSGNSANLGGGGMYNYKSSPHVSYTTFNDNSTLFFGGGMNNDGNSNPDVSYTTFNGNSGDYGAGGMNNTSSSSPSVSYTTFSGNSGSRGGGMTNSSQSHPHLSYVTFSGNSADRGGGMVNQSNGSATMNHVTFSGNSATAFGGGIYNHYESGPTMSHVTFSGNSAPEGGGVYSFFTSVLTMTNTIIANSTRGGDCINGGSTVIDGGHNLIEDSGSSACGLTHGTNNNIVGSDPGLRELADNGGVTLTHMPRSSSIAIDAGADCSGTDQRGGIRPYDNPSNANVSDGCDIGAVERGEVERGWVVMLPLLWR